MKKKIGILTWHYFLNFGSALQAYALKTVLTSFGHCAEIINYRNAKYGNPPFWKDLCRVIISKLLYKKGTFFGRRITYPFLRFHYDRLRVRRAHTSLSWLRRKAKRYECIICGSDQIWAPNVLDEVYLLTFVPSKTGKVSYAASIGLNEIPENLLNTYTTALQDFASVSVREEKGRQILQEKCGIMSEVVLDPTLLVSADEWKLLERCPQELSLDVDTQYVFCYFLKNDNAYRDQVITYAEDRGLSIIGYSLNELDHIWMQDVTGKIGPSEFLWLLRHAETVITDSYHGTIFSMLYHKNFFTFQRFLPDDPICQNSRIEQLNSYFSIADHFVSANDELYDRPMDYDVFEKTLSQLREKAKKYLKTALGDV